MSKARELLEKQKVDVETARALLRHEKELEEAADEWERIFAEDERES
ncbi:hypothetical protein [Paenibacillus mesophilus]|nr:hypothetical protein [Paenibacillus mesophilus]